MSDPKFPPMPTVILTHNAGPATPHDHLGEVLSSALDWEHRAREAEARARQACQTLVEAFGSVGPESVEHAAVRAAEAHARLLDTASELPGLRMTLYDAEARVAELFSENRTLRNAGVTLAERAEKTEARVAELEEKLAAALEDDHRADQRIIELSTALANEYAMEEEPGCFYCGGCAFALRGRRAPRASRFAALDHVEGCALREPVSGAPPAGSAER